MDNLARPLLTFLAVVDGTFLSGLLSGLHLPQNEEGWGAMLGATLLLIISQLVQGRLNGRGVRALRKEIQALRASAPPQPVTP